MKISQANVSATVKQVFTNAQFNRSSHNKYIKELTEFYEKASFDAFCDSFIRCLKVIFVKSQKHPHIDNALDFAAAFATSFQSTLDDSSEESMSPFLTKIIEFLLSCHNAKDATFRFHICDFLNKLLNSMGEEASIDDHLWDKITTCMTERMLDRSAKVRQQAAYALYRLQDPNDPNCAVIKMYMFHLGHDPNPGVRKTVLSKMGKNQKTLGHAIKRTHDVNETVRKQAYEYISKITVRSLSIKQREQLLNEGLKDRAEIVRKTVENILLPAWLRHYKGKYISLLQALDAEIGTETSILSMKTLFKTSNLMDLIDELPIDKITKLTPLEELSSEKVLYWRYLLQYLNNQQTIEQLEHILPELSKFCSYIRDYLNVMSSKQFQKWEMNTQKFILLQFFEMSKVFDLSDESGRKNLKELILDTLMTDYTSPEIIKCIVQYLETIIPSIDTRVDSLTHVINEIRLPSSGETQPGNEVCPIEQRQNNAIQKAKLKVKLMELHEEEYVAIHEKNYLHAESLKGQIQKLEEELTNIPEETDYQEIMNNDQMREEKKDPETLIKCLSIIHNIFQSKIAITLTPTLRSLMQIALDNLGHANDQVHILVLTVLNNYCLVDSEIAKKYYIVYLLELSSESEHQELWIISLKSIFDLLLLYGLEFFDILPNQTNNLDKSESRNRSIRLYSNTEDDLTENNQSAGRIPDSETNCNLIKIMMGLLDNENSSLRFIVVEGFCKLLIHCRINDYNLLSRLIILCYNPTNEEDHRLRQCLSVFFNNFVSRVEDAQEMFERALIPTLQTLFNAPDISPLQGIDPYEITLFILTMTKHKSINPKSNYCSHTNLAFIILAEILNPDSHIDKETLIKSLKHLETIVEEYAVKENLNQAVDKVLDQVRENHHRLIPYVLPLKKRLESRTSATETSEDPNEEEEIFEDELDVE